MQSALRVQAFAAGLRFIVYRYTIWPMAIQSFKCSDTATLASGVRVKRFVQVEGVARRKLAALDAANELRDLASPPGNRLELFRGDRAGQHSIRINDQFRVCFVWTDQGPKDVEIVDYH